jgi:hypothetical protein
MIRVKDSIKISSIEKISTKPYIHIATAMYKIHSHIPVQFRDTGI